MKKLLKFEFYQDRTDFYEFGRKISIMYLCEKIIQAKRDAKKQINSQRVGINEKKDKDLCNHLEVLRLNNSKSV